MHHNTGRQDLLNAIGNTPLIRLKAVSDATGCDIYGKAEFMNPGGSVKDRAALAIIEGAEADGHLAPGGIIVEGTAGNTGIGRYSAFACRNSVMRAIYAPFCGNYCIANPVCQVATVW